MTLASRSAFEKLLAFLNDDRVRAGEEYERARRKLIIFFEGWRQGLLAPELADRTLDIVARRLEEGVHVKTESRMGFVLGVARNVLRDHLKTPKHTLIRTDVVSPAKKGSAGDAQRFHCFEHCMSRALSDLERELILSFYQEERRRKIENRSDMALRLGITPEALRSRMHRIRVKLETCVGGCMQSQRPNEE